MVMTNSSWTAGHIDQLWSLSSRKIFPPCDVRKGSKILYIVLLKKSSSRKYSKYTSLPIENRNENLLISVAQFRPEKNHLDQGILAFKSTGFTKLMFDSQ